jgi:cytochrome c-type biogenesis protein CcmH
MDRAAELNDHIFLAWLLNNFKRISINYLKKNLKFSRSGHLKYFSFVFLLIILFCHVAKSATESFVFETAQEQKQFELLIKEFRCVTCPNQNIADSQAPVAAAMRQEVYRRVREGESQECIRRYLFSQYGDYVSYKPIIKPQNFPLWIMPFLMLAVGILIWVKSFSRKRIR